MKKKMFVLAAALFACSPLFAATKVIEWKFDGTLSDTSGSGLDATPFPNAGAIVYDAGVSGQALLSDGTNCACKTGISTSVLPVLAADTWSVNVWVYPTALPQDWRMVWCLGNKPDGKKNVRSIYSSGYSTGAPAITYVGMASPDGVTGTTTYISTHIPWQINQWQMITTTYDGAIVRVYRNGVLIAMRSDTYLDAPGEVRVPSNTWSSTSFFPGKFDEFTVWRGVLTQDEILDLIVPGVLPEVQLNQQVAYYTMEDLAASALPDHSGLAHDGTPDGFTPPVSNWLADGLRAEALIFDGDQAIHLPFAVSQPVNYTVSFWFKSGLQPYFSAFYNEQQATDPGFGYGRGTQLLIRGNNEKLQVISKERDYNTLFYIEEDASAYLDGQTWHHLALVADGEAAQATLYVDGQVLGLSPYTCSSHKTTSLSTSIGYSWADDGFLGEWGQTLIDDVKIYNGALSPAQVKALAAVSNANNDLAVDLADANPVSGQWQQDTILVPGDFLLGDDMESTLDKWIVYAGSYPGTGTISATTNAYAGSGALQWDYELPATTEPNNYSSIVFDFGQATDLSNFAEVSLRLFRHTDNTAENLMFLKFADADMNVRGEAWITDDGAVVEPVDEWSQWLIDPNSLLGEGGQGVADQNDLTDIRYIVIGIGSWDRTDARSGRIDIDQLEFVRPPVCASHLPADLDMDCKVDVQDLYILANEWMYGIE